MLRRPDSTLSFGTREITRVGGGEGETIASCAPEGSAGDISGGLMLDTCSIAEDVSTVPPFVFGDNVGSI